MAIRHCGFVLDLFRRFDRRLIQSMPEALNHTIDMNFTARCGENHVKKNLAGSAELLED